MTAAETTALSDWPTVLTRGGFVLSVAHARRRHVLRANVALEQGEGAILERFGVLFAVSDGAWLTQHVLASLESLSLALDVAA
eukprot:3418939-Prymnesium_polylepis.1